jgi:hypothetical protein
VETLGIKEYFLPDTGWGAIYGRFAGLFLGVHGHHALKRAFQALAH